MSRYRDVLAHPVSNTLFTISTVSILGDWIGFGALLVLAFERSGTVIGPAALFTVQGTMAIASSALLGGRLDAIDRRTGVAATYGLGLLAVLLPVAFGGLWPLYVAVAVLGGLRPITAALRHAVAGNDLPPGLLGATIALEGSVGQLLVAIGLALGGTAAIAIGATLALLIDALTFAFAAGWALRLPAGRGAQAATTDWTAGLRAAFADPAAGRLGMVLVASASVGALPETLAPLGSGGDAWLPWVLSAQAAGTAIGAFALGSGRRFEQPSGLMALLLLSGFTLLTAGLAFDHHPAVLGLANLFFGLAYTYTITARTAFTRAVDNQRLGAAVATAVTLVMFAEAIGSLALGAVAAVASPTTAYTVAATILLVVAIVAAASPLDRRPVAPRTARGRTGALREVTSAGS